MTEEEFPHDMTLGEARLLLTPMIERNGGCRCPLCHQHAQVYHWSLYATAARALMLYYWLGDQGKEFVHANHLKKHGHLGQGDASRLSHWGLVEQESERRPDGGRSGWWRVTDLGGQFVRKQITLPKYVDVYAGRASPPYGPNVLITDCLDREFNYDQMMGGTFGAPSLEPYDEEDED